ncbi:MAG: acyltransferase [Bacteroidota bacterium]
MKFHIPSLNGLRAISILMVIFSHFHMHGFLSQNPILKSISTICFNGPLGVHIFFTISGYLITTLLIREETHLGKISLKSFYFRRTVRIFPAYYFLLLVYFFLSKAGFLHLNNIDWFSSITYTRQFFISGSFETAHLWSLSVEEIFYLIWPAIFIFFKRFRISFTLLFVGFCTFMRFYAYKYPSPDLGTNILTSGDSLLIGCFFAIKHDKILSWMTKWKSYLWLIFPFLAVSVVSYTYLYHLRSAGLSGNLKSFDVLLAFVYSFFGQKGLVTNLLVGFIIMYSISFQTVWYKFLNIPIFDFVGKLSYSLYLWQQLFTGDTVFLHQFNFLTLLFFIFIVACTSYFFIERPFLKLKNFRLKKTDALI